MVNYESIRSMSAVMQHGMQCIEKELCAGPKTTQQLQAALSDNGLGNSIRNVQMLIKALNDVYGEDNHIGRGRIHHIDNANINLAFPELVVNTKDRMVINKILKLANFFDGAVPMKKILEVSGVVRDSMDDILNGIRENADITINSDEARLMADLYDAIDNKYVVNFPYKPLSNAYYGDSIHVSPYYLRQYNSKWFMIGHVENQPKKDIGYNYPWSVFPIKRMLAEGGLTPKIEKSDRHYKDIDRNRIHNYYHNVMGFYVPVEKNAPFVEKLNPEHILIQVNDDKAFRLLRENPIHLTRHFSSKEAAQRQLTIDVVASPSLYSKLLSYGDSIKVLSPSCIRDEMVRQIEHMIEIYKQD